MSVNTRRGAVVAIVLSLSVLVPGSFRMASAAVQPPAAPAPEAAPRAQRQAGQRTPRVNPLNEALKSLTLTAEQESKIKDIRAQARKDLDAAPARGTAERQAKVRELNAKMAADIKALLPADQQSKFQAAFDAAEAKNAEQAKTAGLLVFKRSLEPLSLTAEEQAKVDPIVKDAYDKIAAAREDNTLNGRDRTTKINTIISDMKLKIRPLLAPAKQAQLDTLNLTPRGAQGRRRGGAGAGTRGNGAGGARGANGTTAPPAPAL
jgi:Spy/CpxP family protein refolding chaperone